MLLKSYQLFFFLFLILGTIVAISSNSWFTCWLGLEINLMSLIPLIISELNFKSTEAAIKYFLTQAFASVLLISFSCFETFYQTSMLLTNFSLIVFFSLAMKAGIAPMHIWFPQVMKQISWLKCFMILTWQKLAPFLLMTSFYNKSMLITLMVSSAIVGSIGGLNQINLKLLLTYSSIAHSSWMLMMSFISVNYWILYFLFYVALLSQILVTFANNFFNKATEIFKSKMAIFNKYLVVVLVLSLGGLPPFLGFSIKMISLFWAMKIIPLLVLMSLVSSSLISLFFYLKMFYNMSMYSSMENKIQQINKVYKMNSMSKMMIISLIGNLMISLLVLLT